MVKHGTSAAAAALRYLPGECVYSRVLAVRAQVHMCHLCDGPQMEDLSHMPRAREYCASNLRMSVLLCPRALERRNTALRACKAILTSPFPPLLFRTFISRFKNRHEM